MSLIHKGLLLACVLLAGAAPRAWGAELGNSGVLIDRVAAVVNDGIVLVSDLDHQQQLISDRLQQAGQQLPPSRILRQQVLERLVMQEIQMQRAERLGIKISDEMVNARVSDWLSKVPTFKFVDLLYQLCARMVTKPVEGVHAKNFPEILIKLICRFITTLVRNRRHRSLCNALRSFD